MDINVICYLLVGAVMLFAGVYGFVTRHNLLAILISLELMLNAVDINFVVFNRYLFPGQLEGFFFTLFAVASAIFYVAPPIRYGYRGLGEVMVGINMGFIIVGASSVILAGTFELRALALALPVAGMVAGILYYQSLPEIETDLAAGKHTLANILGKDHALFVFRIWWPAVWILLGNLWLSDLAGWPVVFCLLSVPFWWKAQGLVASRGDGDWLPLDKYGYLVRLCYLISGAALVWGAAWK